MSELPADIAGLERRLGSVRAVGGIVQAIWALSKAQLAQVESFSQEASVHLDWVDEVVSRVAGPPLLRSDEPAPLYLVLGPERGFCGSLSREIGRALPSQVPLGVCGQRLLDHVRTQAALRERVVLSLPGANSVDDLERVAARLAHAALEHGEGRRVRLSYVSMSPFRLRTVDLLPGPRATRTQRDFESYSTPERLLAVAVAESVTGHLRVALAESLRSEVRARAAAAELAKQSVQRQRDALTQALRVLQKEQITSELTELYAGHMKRG